MKISFKHLLGGGIIGVVLLLASFLSLPDGKLHLVFCDVGQGDAIYMRTPDGSDILFDAGPNDKVLTCLGRHMPFYDREIELVLLSHPQADHMNGLISVLQRYNVSYFVSNLDTLGRLGKLGEFGETQGQKNLRTLLKEKKIPQKSVAAGEKIGLGGLSLAAVWPTLIHQTNVLGVTTSEVNVNESSLVVKVIYGSFSALLTGDVTAEVLGNLSNLRNLSYLDVLKIPHHGSKTGMNLAFLQDLRPKLAVISVGLNNSYGHPAQETLKLLKSLRGLRVLRTDLDGEIEIISDGQNWEIK